jgi:hypothetical protein
MSLALIREHADVKEEFDRLSKIRQERFISSIGNMIHEIKTFAANYMKENDFLVSDHQDSKTITGTYKDVKISVKYPEIDERSLDAHSVFEVSHNHKTLIVGASLTAAGDSISGGFISYSSKEDRLRKEIDSFKARIERLTSLGLNDINGAYAMCLIEKRNGIVAYKRHTNSIVDVIDEIIR